MYKNKKWFSFIEIIIVCSILSITAVSWSYYFNNFLQKQEVNIYTNNLEQHITKLDNLVKNNEIYDYQMQLFDWYVSILKNTSWTQKYLQYWETQNGWSYSIVNGQSDDIVYYTLYKWIKKIEEKNISWDSSISIEKWNNYKLEAQIENQNINSAEIFIFDDNNQLETYTIIDNNDNELNSLLIENYWGNKIYKNNSNWDKLDTPIQITFDLHGYENTLIIEE